jgi:hypothetical protein
MVSVDVAEGHDLGARMTGDGLEIGPAHAADADAGVLKFALGEAALGRTAGKELAARVKRAVWRRNRRRENGEKECVHGAELCWAHG